MTRARTAVAAVFVLGLLCAAGILYKVNTAEAPAEKGAQARQSAFPEVGEEVPDLDATAEWNTYHGSAALTGIAASDLADSLRPYWRFTAEGDVFNTPVAAAGRVFFTNSRGKVFAVDLQGRPLWSKQLTAGTRPDGSLREAYLDAPIVCFGGLLYVGDADGVVLALDSATGEEQWRQDLDVPLLGTPNLSDSAPEGTSPGTKTLCLIGQDEGTLHCLDAVTGSVYWTSEGVSRCDGSPGVGGGAVIFGSCDSALHIFSSTTGALEHNVPIDEESQVAAGIAIDGESAFTGCRSGQVLQVNVRTGEVVWSSQPTDFEIFTTPAVNAEWVILGAEDGFLYALDRTTGKPRWKFDTEGTPLSPAIAGDKVVVSTDCTLHLLKLENGEPLWSYEVSDAITAPAVVGPLVVVGCDDGTVAAFYGGEAS